MAAGKKKYIINTVSYGKSFKERAGRFEGHTTEMRAVENTGILDSTTRRRQSLDFYASLLRNDKFLEEPPTGMKARVDPIRALSNRLWSVKGSGDSKEMLFLSGAMTLEAEGSAYNSQPFDIVFSDAVTKTGDGILPDSVEDIMLKWRDEKNGAEISSGLFPVYQENIKLIPVESTFNQYYLALTGFTPEDIAGADEKAEDQAYGEKMRAMQLGAIYQREGSVYLWNLMRYFIGAHGQVTKAMRGYAYEDYSSYVNVPFNILESKIMSFDSSAAFARCASEYNFYSKMYEDFSKNAPELLLPSLLLQQSADSNLGDPNTARLANDNISLGGAISMATCGNVMGSKKKSDADPAEAMTFSSAYWNEFGAVLSKIAKAAGGVSAQNQTIDALADSKTTREVLGKILSMHPAAASVASKIKNIVFSGDYGSIIADSDSRRENYPMYADINFASDHFAQFSDHINSAGLMPDLIDSLIASEDGGERLTQDIGSQKKPVISMRKPIWESTPKPKLNIRTDGDITMSQAMSIKPVARPVFDAEAWLYKILNNQQDTQKMTGRLHAHASGLSGDGMTNSLEKQIKTIIALGKIKNMVADNVRRYSQVLKGESAYNEVVAYQVTKRVIDRKGAAGERNSGKFVQNFWFANSSDITNINFFDTQVHYGKTYYYEIWAHTLVIGTKYDIGNNSLDMSPLVKSTEALNSMLQRKDQTLKTMVFKDAPLSQAVWYTPSLKIIKTPVFNSKVSMYDSAPIVPEIEFVPYKGNNHKLLLILKGSVGRVQMPTVHINTDYAGYGPTKTLTEKQAIDKQWEYQSQELLPGENLLYESDDRPEFFEIYRTTRAPYSYSDFDGKMVYRVNTLIPSEKAQAKYILPKYGDSATMKEIIVPNKKYYYTARQVDVHGNFSNPTPVFEVEIVDQQGMVYPMIKEYKFKDPVPKTNRKYFNKHIKIAPSPQQVLINTDNMTTAFDAANGAVQLGVADANIWGKKYKVRITSTTTGKSADLNINFNQEHNKTEAETEGTDVIDKETGVVTKTKDITAGATGQKR